ncbi:hypothetical protein FALBO_172 [Fusarium albosuccineum]|uniref:Uncharacterized protein n=1 Tax=Fusarium albosuccineum TaxID=1237068 RepID=A0A8H4PMG3_9HYPO|nr:hypothetical protein FALBO_172 [Fusarium albosuccineum]
MAHQTTPTKNPPEIPIPPAYYTTASQTVRNFRIVHEATGKWPWDLVQGFQPESWSHSMLQEFTNLVARSLPAAPDVTLDELLDYLRANLHKHSIPRFQQSLNRVAIENARLWLGDKSRGEHDTGPSAASGSGISSSSLSTFSSRSSLSLGEDLESEDGDEYTVEPTAARNPRKRPAVDYNENDIFERMLSPSPEPQPPKKRRMVVLKFTPLGGQIRNSTPGDNDNEGDCISVATRPPVKTATALEVSREDTGQSNRPLVLEHRPASNLSNGSDIQQKQPDHRTAFMSWLESRISKSDVISQRAQDEADKVSKQQRELFETIKIHKEEKEQAIVQVWDAQRVLDELTMRIVAESDLQQQLRRVMDGNGSIASPGLRAVMNEYESNQKTLLDQKRQAQIELAEARAHLSSARKNLDMAEYRAAPLETKLENLREIRGEEQRQKRSNVVL